MLADTKEKNMSREVTHEDPLVALVVKPNGVDRNRLASALQGWARIDPRGNLIRYMPGAKQRATIKQLTLVVLLAQMAIKLLNDEREDGLAPRELAERTGVKERHCARS